MGRRGEGVWDRHPGPDGQTDRHTRQNLYILVLRAVISVLSPNGTTAHTLM